MNSRPWTLVTGGAKGLGAQICKTLSAQGYSVLIHYRKSYEEAVKVRDYCRQQGVSAECIQGDFSSTDDVNQFIDQLKDQFPNIAAIVNNVGNYLISGPLQTSDAEWQALFQVNLHAPISLIRALLPSLIENLGAIVNIGVAGLNHLPSDTYSTAYTTAKLALWATTRAFANELAPFGVRANMVSPGMLENTVDRPKDVNALPMRRLGTLEETARVVAFLLSGENSYINGQNIEVAGGIRLFKLGKE